MDINLELYKVFYYVATTLSFSEASRELFISQSAVSQSIKTLEKKLNHTLFIRSTKKVLLTPEGELLLQHVKPAIQMLDEGESLLSGDNMLKGQLRLLHHGTTVGQLHHLGQVADGAVARHSHHTIRGLLQSCKNLEHSGFTSTILAY